MPHTHIISVCNILLGLILQEQLALRINVPFKLIVKTLTQRIVKSTALIHSDKILAAMLFLCPLKQCLGRKSKSAYWQHKVVGLGLDPDI